MPTHGVAVTVPSPFRERLRAARAAVGDPMAGAIPPHVTLLPPTPIEAEDLPGFTAHLQRVAASHPAFEMRLNGAGTFRPISPVVFVQVSFGISSCEELERALRSGPVERTLEFPYHPHVTVAHHVPEARLDAAFEALGGFRARFTVASIDLYEQGVDAVWRPQRAFPLGRRDA